MENQRITSGSDSTVAFSKVTTQKRKLTEVDKKSVQQAKKLKTSSETLNENNNSLSGRVIPSINLPILDEIIKTKKVGSLKEILERRLTQPLTYLELDKIHSIRKDSQINTFKLVVAKNEPIYVNLEILSWSSTYFKKIYNDCKDKEMEIEFVAMQDLIQATFDFCYGFSITKLEMNVQKFDEKKISDLMQLLEIAKFFGIDELRNKIGSFFQSNIKKIPLQHLLKIFEEATNSQNQDLKNAILNQLLDISFQHSLFSTPEYWLSKDAIETIDVLKENFCTLITNFSKPVETAAFFYAVRNCPNLKKIILSGCDSISFQDLGYICSTFKDQKSLRELTIRNYKIPDESFVSNPEIYAVECVDIDDIFRCLEGCDSLQTLELSGGTFFSDSDELKEKMELIVNGDDVTIEFKSLSTLILRLSVPFTLVDVMGSMLVFPSLCSIAYTNDFPLTEASFELAKDKFNVTMVDLEKNGMEITISNDHVSRKILLNYLGKQNP